MKQTKRYDYVHAIKDEAGVSQDHLQIKRILRKLVREAILRAIPSNEPTLSDKAYANQIAKELVP